jgi:hypothetical protein
MDIIELPVKVIDGRKWIILNAIDDKFLFRAVAISKPQSVKDPSDHRAFQVIGEGNPKCSPKRYDISQFR